MVKIEVKNSVLAFLFGIFLVSVVFATWDSSKMMFHDANDVKVNIAGTDYSLQEALDDGIIISASVYVENGFGCSGSDIPLRYKTEANYCYSTYGDCTTGSHDWDASGDYQETCEYFVRTVGTETCYATTYTLCAVN